MGGACAFGKAIWDAVGERKNPKIVFEHPGEATLLTSGFVCDTGGMVVICAGTTSYNVTLHLRYHWMMQKCFQGSHLANDEQAEAARELDKPIISAINGFALGGGLEIALMCDLRIAGKSAKLGLPDAHMGFSPAGGLTWLLTKMVGLAVAMDRARTTDMLDAEESLRVGLVSRVVEDD